MEYQNIETKETAPAHYIGTNEEGEKVYQSVEGFEPLFNYYTDEDGNWVLEA